MLHCAGCGELIQNDGERLVHVLGTTWHDGCRQTHIRLEAEKRADNASPREVRALHEAAFGAPAEVA